VRWAVVGQLRRSRVPGGRDRRLTGKVQCVTGSSARYLCELQVGHISPGAGAACPAGIDV
jgi:hypothetical protein